MKEKFI